MRKILFVLAAVIISNQLCAQDTSRIRRIRATEPGVPWVDSSRMENVTVTANKYPKKQNETGKVVTIIGKQELERNAGKPLSELLNNYAGMNMLGTNNNLGNNITSSIRGSSAGNVLILIDGIPANDPSVITNYFDLNFISPDQVERIEILKGGQSSLYGSDAASGVINIITRKAGPKKFGLNGTFTGGSYHTLRQSIGVNGMVKGFGYSTNYTHINARGFSSAYDKNKTGLFDNDGYNQHAVDSRFRFNFNKTFALSLFGIFSRYDSDLDASAFTDERDFDAKNINKQVGGGLSYYFTNKGAIHANYSFNHAKRDYLNDSLHQPDPYAVYSKSDYIGRTHFTELYMNWKFDKSSAKKPVWEVLAGVDYRAHSTDQSYFSTGLFGPYNSALTGKLNQVSPYTSVSLNKEKGVNAELGGRLNIHSVYGNNFTFNVNPFFLLENRNKIFANFYTTFKAPTLYQLYDGFAGNPELKPETGIVAEAGLQIKSIPAVNARVVGFYSKAKNNILFTSNPMTFESKYLNVAKQTNYGAELEFTYAKEKKELSFNYTYTNGKTTAPFDGTGAPLSKDTTYFNLYRIPKHAVNLVLGYHPCKTVFTSLRVHAVSDRDEYVYAGVPEILKGYVTIDLYGEYRFGNFARLFLDLKNITNKQYFDFLGYNTRRFNFTAGVSFQL